MVLEREIPNPYKIGVIIFLQPYFKLKNNSMGTLLEIICFNTSINQFL